jgi:RNA polymerase sigma factor (sigma-70 family)
MASLSPPGRSQLGQRYSRRDDAALAAGCLRGDEAAWEELLARYGRLIFTIALRAGLSHADAEEVYQNVCVIVLNHLTELQDRKAGLRPWLATVARREAWRFARQSRRHVSLDEGASGGSDSPQPQRPQVNEEAGPEEEVMALVDRSLVRRGLETLPERCRRLLTALYMADPARSYAEVAETLGVSVGSIGPTRGRCLESLRKILREMGF